MLNELYQEMILDHSKHPRNLRPMKMAERSAHGYNPLCGDQVTVYVALNEGRISDISFEGSGCAISTASASLMTEALRGRTPEEAENLFQEFHSLVTGGGGQSGDLAKLAVFAGVEEFPSRVKCATLPWHTFRGALRGEEQTVSTEAE